MNEFIVSIQSVAKQVSILLSFDHLPAELTCLAHCHRLSQLAAYLPEPKGLVTQAQLDGGPLQDGRTFQQTCPAPRG